MHTIPREPFVKFESDYTDSSVVQKPLRYHIIKKRIKSFLILTEIDRQRYIELSDLAAEVETLKDDD